MTRFRLLVAVLFVALAALGVLWALGQWLPARSYARAMPVPGGDQEIAWLHTSTSASTWERFVTGVLRVPGFEVDDSRAFLARTASVPEVVLSRPGLPGKLRIRWYKLTGDVTSRHWVDALAERDPPPLAVIGGGSTDRAVDLARALEERATWKGKRPLFLITTATANSVLLDEDETIPASERVNWARPLMSFYPGRSFRFCFTNEQMARAVLDFVWQTPDLRPRNGLSAAAAALGIPAELLPARELLAPLEGLVQFFRLQWQDDPYSVDLADQFFNQAVARAPVGSRVIYHTLDLRYSVGRYDQANASEAEVVQRILEQVPTGAGSRSLLALPTIAPPARRVLHALTGESALIGRHLVAITGDGIAINTIYRDADIAWPLRDLPVPLVLFSHQNPIAWDQEPGVSGQGTGDRGQRPEDAGQRSEVRERNLLLPPNSTEDVLLFAEVVRRAANAAFADQGGLIADADLMAGRLRTQDAPFFDENGDRIGGKGEFVVCLRPQFADHGRLEAKATIEVWHRRDGKRWEFVGRLMK
jgi:hypothetical protein